MSAVADLIVAVVLTSSLLECGVAIILAHHTTVEFKCTTNGDHTPDWFVNGKLAVTAGDSYRSRTSNGGDITTILTIDGNGTQVTFNIHCEVYVTEERQFLRVYGTTIIFQGFLDSPENVFINSSTIEWKPPYFSLNNDTVHVDPHITQYTVYITDNYTGDSIVEENVTETKYTFNIQDDNLCPTYRVSAWNVGGEGELSEPVQESSPQGISGDVVIVAPGVSVEFTCTGPDSEFPPTWFLNGRVAETEGDCYRSRLRRAGGLNATDTLTINGNYTCDMFNTHCKIYRESQFLYLHYNTLLVQGHLSSPESIHINGSVNSSTIQWIPPYSALNNDTIHVDPHITQYTVYITDNYTGNVVKVNVTETQFTFNIQDDDLCPMYQVSAWNTGGEGKLSEPVQELSSVPRSIAAVSITAEVTVESTVVHIRIEDVDVQCISRMPEYFVITLMTSAWSVFNETRQHQPGQSVANFNITLLQNVDVCSLHVRICAGNSAGMSAPSEAVEAVCSGGVTDSTTTISYTVPVSTGSYSGSEGNGQQGDSTTLIVVLIGVIAAIVGVWIVAATVGIIYYRGRKKDKLKKHEIEMKPNQAYETVTRPQPATQVHTEPCPAYEVVVHAHH